MAAPKKKKSLRLKRNNLKFKNENNLNFFYLYNKKKITKILKNF